MEGRTWIISRVLAICFVIVVVGSFSWIAYDLGTKIQPPEPDCFTAPRFVIQVESHYVDYGPRWIVQPIMIDYTNETITPKNTTVILKVMRIDEGCPDGTRQIYHDFFYLRINTDIYLLNPKKGESFNLLGSYAVGLGNTTPPSPLSSPGYQMGILMQPGQIEYFYIYVDLNQDLLDLEWHIYDDLRVHFKARNENWDIIFPITEVRE